ncbi:MAG: Sec-independent protein translocase protein TatB [Pseudomonadota bacterium]|nr:Sec-independent protein translocase protein TatB [Pseudomonadota bacterium]
MLDFGFSEILLTSAIALVVLGPERLPKVARQVGNWMGRARSMARQLSEQLEREVSADELMKEHRNAPPLPSDAARSNTAVQPVADMPPTLVAQAPPTAEQAITAARADDGTSAVPYDDRRTLTDG